MRGKNGANADAFASILTSAVAYNMCTERAISVNENIEEFIALAEKIKRQEDAFKKKEPKERPLPKKKPDVRESEDNNEPAMSLEVKHKAQEWSL